MGSPKTTIKAVLYTKENCSLCDQVKEQLIALSERFPHQLEEVDITRDKKLWAQYRLEIPVVHIRDAVLKAPINRMDLIRALSVALAKV